jgi:hypothetical protein
VLGELSMSFFGACPIALGCLTSLQLDNIKFSELAITTLMGTCSELRHLSLKYCDSCRVASTLKIDAPRSKLHTLKLRSCGYRTVYLVSAPKLVELHFHTWYGDNLLTNFGCVPASSWSRSLLPAMTGKSHSRWASG